MLRSVRAGRRVQLNDVGLFSDGTAVKMVGAETFKLTRQYVDDFVVVNTDAICAAIRMCSRTRAACWSRPAPWPSPPPSNTRPSIT